MASRYSRLPEDKFPVSASLRKPSYEQPRAERYTPQRQWIRRIIPAILTLVALFSLFRAAFVCRHHYDPAKSFSQVAVDEDSEKVPLEIHVMSKCPDARDCLRDLILPTMVEVSDKVNFTMSFIGRYSMLDSKELYSLLTCSLASTPSLMQSLANTALANASGTKSSSVPPKFTQTSRSGSGLRIA